MSKPDLSSADENALALQELARLALAIDRKLTRVGSQVRLWSSTIRNDRTVNTFQLSEMGVSQAIRFASQLSEKRVVRDRRDWQEPEKPLASAPLNTDEPSATFAHRSVTNKPSRSSDSQQDFTDTNSSARSAANERRNPKQLLLRSLRRAIDTKRPEAPESHERVAAQLWDQLDHSSSHPMPHEAKERLADSPLASAASAIAGEARVFDDGAADAVAKHYDADAVAKGDKIAFRLESFRPETTQGLALLGHELTHLGQVDRGMPNDGGRPEEHQALSTEREILRLPLLPLSATLPVGRPQADVSQARTAAVDRPLDVVMPMPSSLTEHQIRELKEKIYRELVNRIRVEFERSGN